MKISSSFRAIKVDKTYIINILNINDLILHYYDLLEIQFLLKMSVALNLNEPVDNFVRLIRRKVS